MPRRYIHGRGAFAVATSLPVVYPKRRRRSISAHWCRRPCSSGMQAKSALTGRHLAERMYRSTLTPRRQ